jgi:hypothetical protein
MSAHLHRNALFADSQELDAAPSRPPVQRPAWLWVLFAVLVAAGLAGGYVFVFENPALANITYTAHYGHDALLSGTAAGYFRSQYHSIVVHDPRGAPLGILVDGRRYSAEDLTPAALTKLGAVASPGAQSTLWQLKRGADSLWCDFHDNRLIQVWIKHDPETPASGGGAITVSWNDGPPTSFPVNGQDLATHFGPPRQVTRQTTLRFLAGL